MENCYTCGTKLQETSWGRKFCCNCGIIEDINETTESDEKPSYV